MNNESLIILGLLMPLFSALGSYCFKNKINVRDSFGVLGGIITFIISLKIFNGIQSNEQYVLNFFTLFDGVDFLFNVTPLGSIFSLVASSLWILASIYTVGYMR